MQRFLTAFSILVFCAGTYGQKPKNGSFAYVIAFAEWGGKSLNATCTVIIKGDSIKVVHDGNKSMTGKKGDIIEEGIIMKHKKSGKWIIGHSIKDKDAAEVGGCSEGPAVIDFKLKKFWSC